MIPRRCDTPRMDAAVIWFSIVASFMPWFVVLGCLLSGCLSDAEAFRDRDRRKMGRAWGSSAAPTPDAGFAGTATYNRTWTIAFDGRNCVNGAFNPWSDQTALGINMALDATDTGYSCDYVTTGLNEVGFGTPLKDNGVRVAQTTAGCWADASPTGFPTIADGDNFVVRAIFRANTAPSAGTFLHEWNPGGSELIQINYLTGDQLRMDVDEAGGTEYVGANTAAVSAGAWHFMDAFYDAVGAVFPVITICLDGTCTTQTEHVGLHGAFGPSGAFAVGGSTLCGSNIPDTTILFLAYAVGANAAFWSETTHDSDCQSTGICP